MSSPLPRKLPVEPPEPDQVQIDLDHESAASILAALRSETARDLLSQLAREPATASELAEQYEVSLQAVHYHLERLRSVGLVTQAATWYSTRGVEMTVYALAVDCLAVRLDSGGRDDAE